MGVGCLVWCPAVWPGHPPLCCRSSGLRWLAPPCAARRGRWSPPALVSCPGVLLPWPPAEVGDEGVLELIR